MEIAYLEGDEVVIMKYPLSPFRPLVCIHSRRYVGDGQKVAFYSEPRTTTKCILSHERTHFEIVSDLMDFQKQGVLRKRFNSIIKQFKPFEVPLLTTNDEKGSIVGFFKTIHEIVENPNVLIRVRISKANQYGLIVPVRSICSREKRLVEVVDGCLMYEWLNDSCQNIKYVDTINNVELRNSCPSEFSVCGGIDVSSVQKIGLISEMCSDFLKKVQTLEKELFGTP